MKERPPKLETNPWVYGAEVDENEPITQTARSIWWCDVVAIVGQLFEKPRRFA